MLWDFTAVAGPRAPVCLVVGVPDWYKRAILVLLNKSAAGHGGGAVAIGFAHFLVRPPHVIVADGIAIVPTQTPICAIFFGIEPRRDFTERRLNMAAAGKWRPVVAPS